MREEALQGTYSGFGKCCVTFKSQSYLQQWTVFTSLHILLHTWPHLNWLPLLLLLLLLIFALASESHTYIDRDHELTCISNCWACVCCCCCNCTCCSTSKHIIHRTRPILLPMADSPAGFSRNGCDPLVSIPAVADTARISAD